MKRTTMIAALLLACAGIHAQGLTLSLDITAGGLKDAMTPEQRKAVTNLTLTGSMNDADFYLIRDSMRRLDFLDLKYVQVDTIPVKAMFDFNEPELILPVSVKFLGDSAFYLHDNNVSKNNHIYITGEFPKLGKGVFISLSGSSISVSEDNPYCKKVGENIYSMDGKILYLCRGESQWGIEEGVEVIESRALDEVWFARFILPSSVKLIKENAFSNFYALREAGIPSDERVWFSSEAKTPPVLEKNAFDAESMSLFILNVPEGTKEAYRNADPQWSFFKDITDYPSGIQSVKDQRVSVETNSAGEITVISEQEMACIEIISLSGKLLQKIQAGNCLKVSVSNCLDKGFIIRTVFADSSEYTLKYFR